MTNKSNIEKIRDVKNSATRINKTKEFPKDFPFWARIKISKHRTTLVIDEEKYQDKKTKKDVDGYVHREATSQYHKGFEEIIPNPDKDKRPNPMYLKSPRKLPKRMFEPHNKDLEMPEHLKDRYSKNNKKQAQKKNYNPTLSAIP